MARKPTKKAPTKKAPAKVSAKKAPARAVGKGKPGAKGKPRSGAKSPAGAKPLAGPKLLSGGNPQIAKADGNAPVQAYINAMPGWKRDVGRRLDVLIERVAPDVRKAVRWNSPFYGVPGGGWFLNCHCLNRYVKIAFFDGTSLDPVPPVESKKAGIRYVHIHEGEEIDEGLFESWVRQAVRLPGVDWFWGGSRGRGMRAVGSCSAVVGSGGPRGVRGGAGDGTCPAGCHA